MMVKLAPTGCGYVLSLDFQLGVNNAELLELIDFFFLFLYDYLSGNI